MKLKLSTIILAGVSALAASAYGAFTPLPSQPGETAGPVGQSFACAQRPYEFGCQTEGKPLWLTETGDRESGRHFRNEVRESHHGESLRTRPVEPMAPVEQSSGTYQQGVE